MQRDQVNLPVNTVKVGSSEIFQSNPGYSGQIFYWHQIDRVKGDEYSEQDRSTNNILREGTILLLLDSRIAQQDEILLSLL